MKRALIPLAALVLAAPPLAAEDWQQTATLPGGIALQLDKDSVFEVLDGNTMVLHATFRRELPMGTMDSYVAVDCHAKTAKIRRVKLFNGDNVSADNTYEGAQYAPVSDGSAEAFYFDALCGDGAPAAAPAKGRN